MAGLTRAQRLEREQIAWWATAHYGPISDFTAEDFESSDSGEAESGNGALSACGVGEDRTRCELVQGVLKNLKLD